MLDDLLSRYGPSHSNVHIAPQPVPSAKQSLRWLAIGSQRHASGDEEWITASRGSCVVVDGTSVKDFYSWRQGGKCADSS